MMRALYSGVSGLRIQQTKLDVISNNISNVNTIGYKCQNANFSDLLSQTLRGATGGSSNKGGTNAMQVGLGAVLASINTLMTPGSTQSTGDSSNAAIGGDGFFIVKGGTVGEYQFTRAGNFGVDSKGNLTVNGYKICGWQQYSTANGKQVFDEQMTVEPINLFSDSYNGNKRIMAAKATSNAALSGNLDPTKTAQGTALNGIGANPKVDMTSTMEAYDAQGNCYNVQVNFSKCFVDNTDPDNPITSWYWETNSSASNVGVTGSGYLKFDKNGALITTDSAYPTTSQITLTPTGSNSGSAPFKVNLDLSKISTYKSSDTNKITATSDGYEAGSLQDYSIGADGVVTGIYSNGEKQLLGKLGMAVFSNPAGLEKLGGGIYATTANSGDYTGAVSAGSAGSGELSPGTLEMSNVDLAEQFSEMMITQRAYQANSKVISAADEILQTLVNLIR
jgi:flagellar hook protein FlgE